MASASHVLTRPLLKAAVSFVITEQMGFVSCAKRDITWIKTEGVVSLILLSMLPRSKSTAQIPL